MNRGRRKRESLAAHHVISKQYKHQGDNQHHGTSILLGRERESLYNHSQQSLFLKRPHNSLYPG